jgi:hypothetical protein
MHAPDGATDVTFAITKLFIGDTDPDGTPDATNGWKHFGYNIDGVPVEALGTFCEPVNGANPQTVHEQGEGGIENAFGHLVVPLILSLASDASTQIDSQLASGAFTSLFTLGKLGAGAEYDPLPSQAALGGALGMPPKFDGTDTWPVVMGTPISIPNSYLVGNTWVSPSLDGLVLTIPNLPVAGGHETPTVTLTLHHVVLSMQLDAAHQKATGGVISAVVATSDLVGAIQLAAAAVDASFCSPGSTFQSLAAQIQQASDIMQDGTQDPLAPCDGISIGLGFEAAIVQLGPMVAPSATDACDGGVDGG